MRKRRIQRRFLKMDTEILCGRSVDACWHPLTPEHGFPSLYLQDSGRSPSVRFLLSKKCSKKQEIPNAVSPVKNLYCFRKRLPTAALSASGAGKDEKINKRGWREILVQMQNLKPQKYWMYFKVSKSHSCAEGAASRRRFYQHFPGSKVIPSSQPVYELPCVLLLGLL